MPHATLDSSHQTLPDASSACASTRRLDDLRARDFARLDARGHVYLDYTGGGLYAESQLTAHAAILRERVFGNPHSHNPTSSAMTDLVEEARRAVLGFFHADAGEYEVIFTANASGALKLVGEAYPFEKDSHFLLTFDNHNSVNGIREFARMRGAVTTYVPLVLPDMRADEDRLDEALSAVRPEAPHLFAYPAQSNFSGVQHPLEWIPEAQARGWDVLLDAAAFVPTNRLDLSRRHPDYVPISFYKMFGYPTGVGCLLARKEALAKLRRPWFAGGTTTMVSVQSDRYDFRAGGEAFEDGTLNYLSLPAVKIGLEYLEGMGMDAIHERVQCLTGWLLERLPALRHGNGTPLIRLYGPPTTAQRGGTITLNIVDPGGAAVAHRVIEQEASRRMISLRTGTFCNPGGGESALSLEKTETIVCGQSTPQLTMDDFRMAIDRNSLGAVRMSVGPISNARDAGCFVAFVRSFLDR